MNWGVILILAVVVVYAANVLGCLILCETIPELKSAHKYAWYVPILIILLPFFILFDPAIKNKFELIWGFIWMPHKSIAAVSSVADALREQERVGNRYDPFHPKPSRQRQRAYILEGSVTRYGNAIFGTQLG